MNKWSFHLDLTLQTRLLVSGFFLALGIAQFQRIPKDNSFGASKMFAPRDTGLSRASSPNLAFPSFCLPFLTLPQSLKAPTQYAIAVLFRSSNPCPFPLKRAAQVTYGATLTCVF